MVERGLGATGEVKIHVGKRRKLPDVLMSVNGVNVVLEGKYSSATARKEVIGQCKERIEAGIAEVAVGVIYDEARVSGVLIPNQSEIRNLLENSILPTKIIKLGQEGEDEGSGNLGWNAVSIDDLASSIRDASNNVANEDVLASAVERIEKTVDKFSSKLLED